MPDNPRLRFLAKLEEALRSGSFVKLTLSQYRGPESGLRNLYARIVNLRSGPHLSTVWRYATRDLTKNFPLSDATSLLTPLLGHSFERAHLFTTTGDSQLQSNPQGLGKLKSSRPVFTVAPPPIHDEPKRSPIAIENAPFLQSLGVTSPQGSARPGMNDKLHQIQRFVEILGHLVETSSLRKSSTLRVLDMGAGKGYLTFATAAFFQNRHVQAEIVGVEVRQDLVDLTNRVALEVGFSHLHFTQGTIADFSTPLPPDILIALHACDTATDDALHHGIKSGAALIIVAPCCHQELRPKITPPPVLQDILRHGILAARHAEILTDGIRSLLLEIHGYKSSVFEFISPEHTSKNLLIAAHRRPEPLDPAPLRIRLRELMAFYHLHDQRLAQLLQE